jgi:HSP20 family protein
MLRDKREYHSSPPVTRAMGTQTAMQAGEEEAQVRQSGTAPRSTGVAGDVSNGTGTNASQLSTQGSPGGRVVRTRGSPYGTGLTRRTPSGAPVSSILADLWDPLFPGNRSLLQMLDNVDRLFSDILPPALAPAMPATHTGRLPWDVQEAKDGYKLRIDMPGISKENLKIEVQDDNVLVIRGEQRAEEADETGERRIIASYNTRVQLPDNIKPDEIRAELKDGVLMVFVPKVQPVEDKKPKSIPISVL